MGDAARTAREWAIAVALAAAFTFTGLANHALQNPDEPRVAGIAWEMQHTGDWVPHLAGKPFLEHPPLFYAVLGGFIRVFGASDGVARLPSATAAFLTALLVFSLARRFADRSAGIPALLALIGIYGFAHYSHRALVDPLLALFALCGYYAYARAVFGRTPTVPPDPSQRPAPGWLFAVYAAAALAFWVKGPIGVIAIAGPVALEAMFARRWNTVRSPVHLVALPMLVAACAAWPIALRRAGGDPLLAEFALDNVWYRIVPSAIGVYHGGHERAVWFYLGRLFQQLGWSALFVPAVAAWLWRGVARPGWSVPALRFFAWVLPIGVILLSIPETKRALYLLPFEPPLAVAIGAWIAAAGRADAGRSRIEAAVNALCAWITRCDAAAAATGACRAPYRMAAIGFAFAIGWNAIGLRYDDRDRELAPMVRAVDARVGADPLFVLLPSECLLGAFPFYTGRIPLHSRGVEELAPRLAQSGARFLLAPLALRGRIAAELGSGAAFEATWTADNEDYALFAISPAVAPASVDLMPN